MKANRIRDIHPLAPLQQGMIFHSLSDAVPGMYCEQIVGEVASHLDDDRFRAALAHLVTRHGVLRSAFVWQDVDEPLQVVKDDAVVPLTMHDWTALDATDRARRLESLVEDERRRGFDLGTPPLMRADLARTTAGDVFLLTFHHAILDGWSVSIILRELIAIYEGLASGALPRLDAVRPFRDFVAWLRARDTRGAEAFWDEELRGFTTPTPIVDGLVSRGERSGAATHAEEIVRLSVASTDAVGAAARSSGVTLNTFVQGAWALLLSRITGDVDVVFGAVVAGRPPELPGVESMTGVFMNTVPIRTRIEGAEPLHAFLKALQARNARSREHEHVPLARIQAATELTRGLALFESVLIFENYPAEIESAIREATGGTWKVHVRSLQLTNFPLHLMIVPGAELLLDLTFDLTAVSRPMAARLMGALRTLIETMAAQPEAPLGALGLLDGIAADTGSGSGPARPRPSASFGRLFEAACAQHAGRPAARDASGTSSYGELAARARAGAARLAALGAGPEKVVALLGHRDVEYLAAILAVLTAEAAFLPLDPHQPTARQLDILERSGVRVLVGDPLLTEPLVSELRRRGQQAPECVSLSGLSDPGATDSAWQPPSSTGPQQLAYVIYTSGSSGVPKGALLEQRGLVNHLLAKVEELALTPADVVAETAPACFDISIWQFLAPLLAGATVHVCPDDVAFDGTRLLEEVDRAGITILETVPTLLGAMLHDADQRGQSAPRLDRLRLLLSTGEPLPTDVCRAWLARFPDIPVVNAYGPTECSDDVTHHVVDVAPDTPGPIPIGRPLPNTGLRVMDHHGHELPAGFVGELYVGGDGVGRGYLGDPGRTAEAFVESRANGRTERLYRTGDRVRQRGDGVFEYIGRRDDQVKIHGHRIELGEIEARLAEHPAIGAAAVVAAPSLSGTGLVAFVNERAAVGDDVLRSFLRRMLPDYMVPFAFIRREAFPVTSTGKVDRRRLAAEVPQDPQTGAEALQPRDAVEAALAAVWADVLHRKVGVDQNFFELGGDSILIMQVVSRAMQAGLAVTARQMFEHQTVEGVARAIRDAARPVAATEEPSGPASLAPIQAWFFELDIPQRHHWNMSLRLTAREPLDPALLQRTVERVVAHHDALRLQFSLRDGAWSADLASVPHNVAAVVDVSDLGETARNERQRACEREFHTALDLENGPLLRVALFDGGLTGPSEVLFVVHHIVADAVSLRILMEDFETTYLALRDGRTPVLPAPTASFADWARQLRAHANSDVASAEWDHWLEVGAGKRAWLKIDDPAAANAEADARVHEVWLDPAETEGLIRSLPARGITAHDALLAALAESLARHSSDGEIVVDVEGHGRQSLPGVSDATRSIGWFTALYPLALGQSRALGMTERHALVRSAREHVPNGGIGYGLLRYFGGDRVRVEALRARSTPEVSFNYFGQVDAAFAHSALFATGREGYGPDRDPQGTRPHLLDVGGGIFDGRLRLVFLHSSRAFRPGMISALARDFVDALRALITATETVPAALKEMLQHSTAQREVPTADPVSASALDRVIVFDERPIAERILSGELPGVEAAALSYLPDVMQSLSGLDRRQMIQDFCGARPYVGAVLETPLGRVAFVVLPRFASDCYDDPEGLAADCAHASALARNIGARIVSLGGILASATDYGRSLTAIQRDGVRFTTGHATTAAAVILAVDGMLRRTSRDLRRERVAFVGLGSVGVASLRLMLRRMPHPDELLLCEVFRRREALEALRQEVREHFGFTGGIRCLLSDQTVAAGAYDASVIVGATNVPDVLDVARLAPGTILVDDSAPHCFSLAAAARRLEWRGDILFTEGGTLHFPQALAGTYYYPATAERALAVSRAQVRRSLDPHEIFGCIFSSLLSVRHRHLAPVLGVPDVAACEAHLDALTELGCSASPIRGRGNALGELYVPSEEAIASFRERFGLAEVARVVAAESR